jgi:hypothetical protein
MKKFIPLFLFFFACQKSQTQNPDPPVDPVIAYENTPLAITLSGAIVKEASGIADSKTNKGFMWVEQDSGNPPMVYLLRHDGAYTDSIVLEGAMNRDWEDIAVGAGPDNSKSYLYIGETGDNNAVYSDYAIYRLEEPAAGAGSVTNYDKISFTYPDGSHDAEAFLVDDKTKDIYIITKRDDNSRIYKLAYPQNVSSNNVATYVSALGFNGVVSACLSSDGKEVLVKTYTQVFHYMRTNGEALSETLKRSSTTLGYQLEAQGEALTFDIDMKGFYTLSEEYMSIVPKLNFYKRK